MLDVISESGTGFASPSTTTYLSRDGGLNQEHAREAKRIVGRWREALWFLVDHDYGVFVGLWVPSILTL